MKMKGYLLSSMSPMEPLENTWIVSSFPTSYNILNFSFSWFHTWFSDAGVQGDILDFAARLDIAIDVAHAVTYLHMYTGLYFCKVGEFLALCFVMC